MARQFLLLFACIFALNVSLVLSREDYYQHFSNIFSHHHRRSTPDADVVSTEIPVTVTGGMPHADASRSTINYAKKTTGERVEVIQKGYGDYEDFTNEDIENAYKAVLVAQIVGIVISLLSFIIALVIIFYCGKKIGRKVCTGHVVSKSTGVSSGLSPQPPTYELSEQFTIRKT